MLPKLPISAALLAGGKNTRFDGKTKSLQILHGERIINHQLKVLNKLFDEVLIICNNKEIFTSYSEKIFEDIEKGKGPLGGIFTALNYANNNEVFVFASDMPFLDEVTIITQFECFSRTDYQVLIPMHQDGIEPLHGIYSKNIYKIIKNQLDENILSIRGFLDVVNTGLWQVDRLKCFKNLNTPEELKKENLKPNDEEGSDKKI